MCCRIRRLVVLQIIYKKRPPDKERAYLRSKSDSLSMIFAYMIVKDNLHYSNMQS